MSTFSDYDRVIQSRLPGPSNSPVAPHVKSRPPCPGYRIRSNGWYSWYYPLECSGCMYGGICLYAKICSGCMYGGKCRYAKKATSSPEVSVASSESSESRASVGQPPNSCESSCSEREPDSAQRHRLEVASRDLPSPTRSASSLMSSIALAFDSFQLFLATSRFRAIKGYHLPAVTMRLPLGCGRDIQCASAQRLLVLFGSSSASHLLATAPSGLNVSPWVASSWAARIRDRVLRGRLSKVEASGFNILIPLTILCLTHSFSASSGRLGMRRALRPQLLHDAASTHS
jgi:hypothetical protein